VAPSYLEKHGVPKSLADLENHNCISAGAQEAWNLEGPEGTRQLRVKGNIRSNSAELIREALLSGIALGLRGLWEIGPEIKSGALKVVLPQYRGSSNMAIYAVYPCRDFMPTKVNAFIEYIAGHFGLEPYWEKGIVLEPSAKKAPAKTSAKAGSKRPSVAA
jgi:DNA-binding transcriptional LysR family regulator